MAAVAVYFGDTQTVAKCIAIVVFLLITAPVGAHMIGRAAFRAGVPLWAPTKVEHGVRQKLGID